MRRTILLAGVLLSVVALGSDSPKQYDDETENSSIEGAWQIVAICNSGEQEACPWKCVQTFHRGHWSYSVDGELSSEGTYKTDNSRMPAFLDETRVKLTPWTRKIIYRIEGDTLRTAWQHGYMAERPASFDEEGLYILTWKRVK